MFTKFYDTFCIYIIYFKKMDFFVEKNEQNKKWRIDVALVYLSIHLNMSSNNNTSLSQLSSEELVKRALHRGGGHPPIWGCENINFSVVAKLWGLHAFL